MRVWSIVIATLVSGLARGQNASLPNFSPLCRFECGTAVLDDLGSDFLCKEQQVRSYIESFENEQIYAGGKCAKKLAALNNCAAECGFMCPRIPRHRFSTRQASRSILRGNSNLLQ